MKILITGGTGFIGKHLVKGLRKKYNVKVFSSRLSDINALKGAIKGVDVVYHLAAVLGRKNVSKEKMYDINVNGLKNLVDVLDKQKLIFISSVSVYGHGLNLNEESKLNPVSYYGETKKLGEEIVKRYGNYVIIRPSLVYGEGDMFLLKLFKAIKRKRFFLIGSGKNIINLIYVKDLVNFLVSCKDRQGIFVVSSHNISIKDFYKLVCDKLKIKMNKFKIPRILGYFTGLFNDILKLGLPLTKSSYNFLIKNSSFDNSKVKSEGFKETPLELGIDKTIKWYKENNLL